MSDSVPSPHQDASSSTVTVVETEQDHTVPRVTVKLKKPRTDRKVQWSTGTVDNENLNKKKSKCCCIYDKPRKFGESSSSDSDDECEHCQGHVEKKKVRKGHQPSATTEVGDSGSTVTVTEPKKEDIPIKIPNDCDSKETS